MPSQPRFFSFCEELLERYRDDRRVGVISGDNFVEPHLAPDHSYYFSRYANMWGWASWRRSWQLYDFEMLQFTDMLDSGDFERLFDRPEVARYWRSIFERVVSGEINTWAYQLVFTGLINRWHTVTPNRNLVSNLGFGPDATHTFDASHMLAHLPAGEPDSPLSHPKTVTWWTEADSWVEDHVFGLSQQHKKRAGKRKSLLKRLRRRLKRALSP